MAHLLSIDSVATMLSVGMEGVMLIRLMTLATVLMLLACLMIGVTIAMARQAGADELNSQPAGNPAAEASPDIYKFDNLPTPIDQEPVDQDETAPVNC